MSLSEQTAVRECVADSWFPKILQKPPASHCSSTRFVHLGSLHYVFLPSLITTINQFRNTRRPHPCRSRAAYLGGTRACEYELTVRKCRSKRLSSKVSQWAWFGHERASVCFPIVGYEISYRDPISIYFFQGPSNDLAWYFFAPDEGAQEGWNDVLTPEQFAPYVSRAEPR
jgi:hypothetical protein